MELQFQLLHHYCLTNVILFLFKWISGTDLARVQIGICGWIVDRCCCPHCPCAHSLCQAQIADFISFQLRSRCSLPSLTLWYTGALCWDVLPGT